MPLAILYRQVQRISESNWARLLSLEQQLDEEEKCAGHPMPRRYIPLFGAEGCHVRISERIYASYAEFGRLLEQRYQSETLQKLDARKRVLLDWERGELYYVDSGAPVPRWMQAISRKPFDEEHIACAIPRGKLVSADPKQLQQQAGQRRVLYRQIQHVPRELWAEKLEQERLSDAAELAAGNPVPLRYRCMNAAENSHIRISEREYPCLAANCRSTEDFFAERTQADSRVMDAEATRQAYFTWEREELYYVDSAGAAPAWL